MNAYRKFAGIIAVGALTCMAGALTPAFAEGHGGGGGHSSAGAGGGAHAHYTAGGYGGGHYAGGYGGYRGGAYYGHGGSYYGHGGYYGRGYYGGGYYGHGGWYGGRFYGPGFGWFLPVLPAFYATYWFGGIPYYYANDAYYTWSPDYNGYVATDPPAGAVPQPQNDPNDATPPAPNGQPGAGQTYNYPKNGQTDDQQASDRYQCHQWAVSQSGYDPTRNGAGTASGQGDYHRALTACMEGRGYSVR
jgi:hypothetical protein